MTVDNNFSSLPPLFLMLMTSSLAWLILIAERVFKYFNNMYEEFCVKNWDNIFMTIGQGNGGLSIWSGSQLVEPYEMMKTSQENTFCCYLQPPLFNPITQWMAEYRAGVSGVVVIRSVNQARGPDRRNVIIPSQNVAANSAIQKYCRKKHRSVTTVQVRPKTPCRVQPRNNLKGSLEDVFYFLCFIQKTGVCGSLKHLKVKVFAEGLTMPWDNWVTVACPVPLSCYLTRIWESRSSWLLES